MADMKTPYYVVVDWVDGQIAILRDFDISYGIATETTEGRKIVMCTSKDTPGVSVWGSSCGFMGIDIPVKDANKLLLKASSYGDVKLVRYLLTEKDADVHYDEDMSLRCACRLGHYNVVKTLVNKGARMDIHDGRALNTAVMNGHKNIVKFLLEKGALHISVAIQAARGDDEMHTLINTIAFDPSVVKIRNRRLIPKSTINVT
jgi:hypothetical protein